MLTDLVALPGGTYRMGSRDFYPEEAPVHDVTVAPFAIERHPVTNAQFAEFVEATGYVTVAERPLDPALYPGVAPADLLPEQPLTEMVVRHTVGLADPLADADIPADERLDPLWATAGELGIQIFGLGLLGELIIFSHARDLKEYRVERIVNGRRS